MLKERVTGLDREIEKLATQPAVAFLLSMPGVGLRMALAIVGDTGQPGRFRNTHQYVAYCGLAPATYPRDGGGPLPKSRQRSNRHLKRAFLLLAFNQIRWNQPAGTYHEHKRSSGRVIGRHCGGSAYNSAASSSACSAANCPYRSANSTAEHPLTERIQTDPPVSVCVLQKLLSRSTVSK